MAKQYDEFKNFCDMNGQTYELSDFTDGMCNKEFAQKFPGIKGRFYDSFKKCVALHHETRQLLPVTRKIRYKRNPSKHECDARCMGGKCGGTCECKCGGKNHGIMNCG